MDQPEIVPHGKASMGNDPVIEHQSLREGEHYVPESDAEAAEKGPDENWKFWKEQIEAGLISERRWRSEAHDCEELYFGPDNDPGAGNASDRTDPNKITDKTALIHSNIDVLKPLMFSETPQPIVRRRFRGDGKIDETDLMAAECGQRLAQYLIETEQFDSTMEAVRDDWLIAARGGARAMYRADIVDIEMPDPMTGQTITMPIKTDEKVYFTYVEWRRLVLAPSHSWENMPWLAIETPMTRSQIEQRFGIEVAKRFSFNQKGMIHTTKAMRDEDRDPNSKVVEDAETGEPAISPFDVAMVWEIWNKESEQVIWWSQSYQEILDKVDDPLGLEGFYPMPKPILGAVRGQQLNPRPSIKYYEERADEIDIATKKLKKVLKVLSISGLFPGQMSDQIKELLDGESTMIPVESWLALMEKGGTTGIIQWLPLKEMIAAIQALIALREQSKMAMFEASGISDIMRGQGDPTETATAQNLKGRYSGMRLSSEQRKMAAYARDCIQMLVEIGVEHFDTELLSEICGLDLPMTIQDREMMIMQQQQLEAKFQELTQLHQAYAQAVQNGQMPGPVPPAPEPPKKAKIPGTTWEEVHERLRSDFKRKITLSIETQSTILADEQADKEARIEFLSAFSKFVSELAPLADSGHFDYKTVKELLMFGIRGFPKSRTLEGMIAALPDEPQGQPPKDTAIQVAEIRAKVDVEIEKMRMQNEEADRQHETKMKGVDVMTRGAEMAAEAHAAPAPTPQGV